MGYGEKVKKWFFDEDGDGEDIAEDYDAVEVHRLLGSMLPWS